MKKGFTIVELIIVVMVFVLIPIITMWTDRSLDFVLTAIKGHVVHCPMWLAFIAALAGNGFTLVFNIVVEIFRLVK